MINLCTDFILRHSRAILVVIVLITAVAAFLLPALKFDNSVDVFFNKHGESYLGFEEWKEQFGSDQVVMVAFSDRDIFTAENLRLIDFLTSRFERLPSVDKVRSLTNVNDIIGDENDFVVERFIGTIPSDEAHLAALRERALNNPLYKDTLISKDSRTTALVIELRQKEGAGDTDKQGAIESIEAILKKEFPPHKAYYVSGLTAIEHYYGRYMHDDFKRFVPLIFIIIAAILLISFRSVIAALLPLCSITLSLVWTMGFMVACGISINNVTTIIPPILLAVAVADNIHFVGEAIERAHKAQYSPMQSKAVLRETMQHLFVPCFLTSITTVFGFFSLTKINIVPIQELGVVTAAGTFFAYVLTFTFLPAAIEQFNLFPHAFSFTPGNVHFFKERLDRFLIRLSQFNERHYRAVAWGVAIITLLSLLGMTRLKTETSVLEYFKKGSPIYRDTQYIEQHLSGVHFLNVSLRVDAEDYFRSPEILKKIEALQAFLKRRPEVDVSTSVVDFIKEINKSFHNEDETSYVIPASRELIAQYLLLYGADDLDDFVNSQWNWTTIRIRLNEHTTTKLRGVMGALDDYLRTHFQAPVKATYVGQTVLEVESNEAVTKGQIASVVFAMLTVFGLMFVVFRSLFLGVVSIAVNALPLLVNFGVMGLCSIRLNSATAMIAAIGIGIVVDDTIHFIHQFQTVYRQTNDARHAVYETIADKGHAIIVTAVILFFGFGIVSFSQFVPTMYFGILSALLMFDAVWADLILSPSFLLLCKRSVSHAGTQTKNI